MSHPIGEPYAHGLLPTGDGHQVYWEEYGNPAGKPAVVLHGGPGSGAGPWWRKLFDPERYRVVLLDQRGCGRSLPNACDDVAALENNTTAHLIEDLERLREERGIDRWLVHGASWGSTLGLAYATQHPERVSELVLWAVVTTRAKDVHWLTHVMGEVYPDEFDALVAALPPGSDPGNVCAALLPALCSPDDEVAQAAALAWCRWEDRLATLTGPVVESERTRDPRRRLGFARLVNHYFAHAAFLADDAITSRLHVLAGTPTYLLRGRLDIASPLRSAVEVARGIPGAVLEVVEADAHGAGDDTLERLVAVHDRFAG